MFPGKQRSGTSLNLQQSDVCLTQTHTHKHCALCCFALDTHKCLRSQADSTAVTEKKGEAKKKKSKFKLLLPEKPQIKGRWFKLKINQVH